MIYFRFWDRFESFSEDSEIVLTGKRFAIVVDDELLELLRDVDGW